MSLCVCPVAPPGATLPAPLDAPPTWLHRVTPCSRALVAITKLLELGSSGVAAFNVLKHYKSNQ